MTDIDDKYALRLVEKCLPSEGGLLIFRDATCTYSIRHHGQSWYLKRSLFVRILPEMLPNFRTTTKSVTPNRATAKQDHVKRSKGYDQSIASQAEFVH
jgi:hypothetical protein